MRTKHLLVPILSLSLFGLLPALSGCDSLKEKLGMEEAKKEKKDDDDKKKKDKDDDDDDDKEAKGDGSASPSSSGSPSSGGPLPAAGKAASHLPGDCEIALTLNIAKVLGHPSFEKSVVPALEEALKKVSTTGNDAAKADAFLKETGIGAKSFSDFAVCLKDTSAGDPTFSMALAGNLNADSLIPAIEKAADSSVASKIKDIDGRKAIVEEKAVFGQLADGTIGIGKNEALFKALSATGDNATSKYKLDTSKELAFNISESVMSQASAKGGPAELKSIKTVSGMLDLAGGKLSVRVGTSSADDAKKLEAQFTLLKTEMGSKMAGAPPGTADALKNATSKIEGSDLVIESTFPSTAVDSIASLMAEGIKSASNNIKLPKGDGTAKQDSATPATPATPGTPAKTAAAPTATTPAKTAAAPPPPPPKATTPTPPKPPPPPKSRTKK